MELPNTRPRVPLIPLSQTQQQSQQENESSRQTISFTQSMPVLPRPPTDRKYHPPPPSRAGTAFSSRTT